MTGTTGETPPEGRPGPLQPPPDESRGAIGDQAKKTTRKGTPRKSPEERREINRRNALKHGHSRHPLYQIHYNMIRRCESDPGYTRYDIRVVPEWVDVETFIREVEAEIGPRPGKRWSLDRIDNDRGYEPGNIRWASPAMQANNRGHGGWMTAEESPCLYLPGQEHSANENPCADCPWSGWMSESDRRETHP